jgi:WD40 repeat protein
VVAAAGGRPGGPVRLAFPQLDGTPQVTGRVLEEAWQAPDVGDVAVVRLDRVPPAAPVLALGTAAGCRGHRVRSFGFPRHAPPGGHYGYGTAGDLLPAAASAAGLLELTSANDLTTGFSGAPVIDEVTGLVIGMVTAIISPDRYMRGAGIAYATPTETLRAAWPGLAVHEVCPYLGLEPFTAEHAQRGWFHGRAAAVDRVLAGLRGPRRAMLLLGPSGAGKSSLVQAGVLPALAAGALPGSDRWHQVLARPGQDLPAELDRAARSGDERVLLVIDQFEELLTHRSATDQLAALRAAVLRPPAALTVVLVMRDDFYPQLAAQAPELLDALAPGLLNVPATLSTQDLREIITKPAEAVGLRCQHGLAERIIADALAADPETSAAAGHAPATVLPLLELALRQLWERRHDGFLTHDAYQRIGGVAGSLATWCDTAINQLPTAHRPTAEAILTALVRPADDTRNIPAVRQQVPLATLRDLAIADSTTDDVLAALIKHRIVTTHTDAAGVPVAELVHDALIRDWAALREWVNRDHRFHDWLRRADEQRDRWAGQRDPGDLLHGTDLAEGLDWSKQRHLPRQTAEFLEASRQRQQAGIRRARRLNAILAALLVAALAAAGLAFWRQQAAVAAQRVALSRQLAAQSADLIDTDPDLASLLAVHAYRTSPTIEAASSLYTATALPIWRRLPGRTGPVLSVAFSLDGRILATGSGDGTARLWDSATGRPRATLTSHTDAVTSVAFSPDGRTLATGSGDGTARLWDTATGRPRAILTSHTDAVRLVAFSPDGHTLATTSIDGTTWLWDTATGQRHATLTGHNGTVESVAFSPDGRDLATASVDGTTRVWDTATGQRRATLTSPGRVPADAVASVAFSPDGHTLATTNNGTARLWDTAARRTRATLTGQSGPVAFSPDGRTLATGSDDHAARLWDTATGKPRATLTGHTDRVRSVAFSPDSRALATTSIDGTARLWDNTTWQPRATLTGQTGGVAFSPDGRTLATRSLDRNIRLWDTTTGKTRATLSHTASMMSLAFSPNGQTLTTADWDGTVRLRDAATGITRATLSHVDADDGGLVALSPDGRSLATTSPDGAARLWDAATGHSRVTLTGQTNDTISVAFSPDGRTLATGSHDGTARLWDTATGKPRATLTDHTGPVWSVSFSPDGGTLATGSQDFTARLWDTATGRARATLTGHTGTVLSVVFSPDGRTLATGSNDDTARLWDTATGRTRATLAGHAAAVESVAFSPDGRTLATGSYDTTVRLWSIATPDPAAAISKICQVVGRDLTPEERARYQAPTTVCPS